jgi:RNA polymerase sigma-70 factor (ECF subfamily)
MSETQTFEGFMRTYQDMVYSTAVRLLGNEAEAQDVAQEAFLKAYEHWDEICASVTIGGWIRTVTRNLALNHLTRYRARWRFFSELSDPAEDKDFAADLPSPENAHLQMGDADRWQALEQAMEALPDNQRIPLVLYHFEDMSYEDIALRLGVSLAKVKTDIHRARQALYQKLRHRVTECLDWNAPPIGKRTAFPRPNQTRTQISLSIL